MPRKTDIALNTDVTDVINEAGTGGESAPQTIVQTINPGLAKQQADNARIRKLNAEFSKRLKADQRIAYKPPKHYADILGPVYAFTFNNSDVVVRFDGTTQYFPETIYHFLMGKLARILDSNTSDDKIDEL